MSETPRTDAATHDDWSGGASAVDVEVAKQIEVELNQALKERDDALQLARELRDALEQCRDDSVELKGEWEWKRKNAGQRSEREYFAVECHIEMTDAALTKANQLLP